MSRISRNAAGESSRKVRERAAKGLLLGQEILDNPHLDAVLSPAFCNMTKDGIRVLKGVAKTHACARQRKGGSKNPYLVRGPFYDYAACKARRAPKTPLAQDGARVGARKS